MALDYYCDFQVHKHVKVKEQVSRLKAWFESNTIQLSLSSFSLRPTLREAAPRLCSSFLI
ncbi:MAG: DUF2600 family protein [Nostoc sp. C3-bin3]|nr:DUF2600 family protein [Nostoc sp. C3-bin3]